MLCLWAMGWFSRYLNSALTNDGLRRAYQKQQWRKRVDRQMRGGTKPPRVTRVTYVSQIQPRPQADVFVCMLGHHHRVKARQVECDQKTLRARERQPPTQPKPEKRGQRTEPDLSRCLSS